MKSHSAAIKKALRKRPTVGRPNTFLSSGSTLLNLACTGDPDGCFACGHYYLFVGDSDSGKTFLTLTAFAEATIDKRFKKYRLIYDAPEGGALMDLERFFGHRVAERLEPPGRSDSGEAIHSETIEDFYFNVDDALRDGRPFVYVLDSQDSLTSREERLHFAKTKKSVRSGKSDREIKGSYGDAKAKVHSRCLRRLIGPLEQSGSILIIINQTRDSFDIFSPSTYSGGRALKFYATLQLWSSQAGKIMKPVLKKQRQLGIRAKVRVKKNRVTGRDRTVTIPIYHSVGIDEIGSMIEYLVSERYWKLAKGGEEGGADGIKPTAKIVVTDLGPVFQATVEDLVAKIEKENLVEDLREIVTQVWTTVEQQCTIVRRNKYADPPN